MRRFIILLMLTFVLLGIQDVAAEVRYNIQDLGALSGATGLAIPYEINNLGQVVGGSTYGFPPNVSNNHRPFLWEDGTMVQLMDIHGYASSINDFGQVTMRTEGGGIVWKQGVEPILLESLDFPLDSFPSIINDQGWIFGSSRNRGTMQAVIWSAEDGRIIRNIGNTEYFPPIETDTPHNRVGFNAVNDYGRAIMSRGQTGPPSTGDFIVWTDDGFGGSIRIATLGTYNLGLESDIAAASDINNLDHVIGQRTSGDSFFWDDGIFFSIGLFEGESAGRSSAAAINDRDQAVGIGYVSESDRQTGWIWTNGVKEDLNTLIPTESGWEVFIACDINDHGQIIGRGFHDGKVRGFIMTPITEPTDQTLQVRWGKETISTGEIVWSDPVTINCLVEGGSDEFTDAEDVATNVSDIPEGSWGIHSIDLQDGSPTERKTLSTDTRNLSSDAVIALEGFVNGTDGELLNQNDNADIRNLIWFSDVNGNFPDATIIRSMGGAHEQEFNSVIDGEPVYNLEDILAGSIGGPANPDPGILVYDQTVWGKAGYPDAGNGWVFGGEVCYSPNGQEFQINLALGQHVPEPSSLTLLLLGALSLLFFRGRRR